MIGRTASALLVSMSLWLPSCASPSPAAAGPAQRIYDVRDLVNPGPAGESAPYVLAQLAETIKQATDASCWQAAECRILTEDAGYLVVSAGPDLQQRVATALVDVRKLHQPSWARKPGS